MLELWIKNSVQLGKNLLLLALNSLVCTKQLLLLWFKAKLKCYSATSLWLLQNPLLVWYWHPIKRTCLRSREDFLLMFFLPVISFFFFFWWAQLCLRTMTANASPTSQTSLANLKQLIHNSPPLGLGPMGNGAEETEKSKSHVWLYKFCSFQQIHWPVSVPPGWLFIWFYICPLLNCLFLSAQWR